MSTRKLCTEVAALSLVVCVSLTIVGGFILVLKVCSEAHSRYPIALGQQYADIIHYAKVQFDGGCPSTWDIASRRRHSEWQDQCFALDFNGTLDRRHATASSAAMNLSLDVLDWCRSAPTRLA